MFAPIAWARGGPMSKLPPTDREHVFEQIGALRLSIDNLERLAGCMRPGHQVTLEVPADCRYLGELGLGQAVEIIGEYAEVLRGSLATMAV